MDPQPPSRNPQREAEQVAARVDSARADLEADPASAALLLPRYLDAVAALLELCTSAATGTVLGGFRGEAKVSVSDILASLKPVRFAALPTGLARTPDPEAKLRAALAEAGAAIEAMPHDERSAAVDAALDTLGINPGEGAGRNARDFIVGVMVSAHADRLAKQAEMAG